MPRQEIAEMPTDFPELTESTEWYGSYARLRLAMNAICCCKLCAARGGTALRVTTSRLFDRLVRRLTSGSEVGS
jgi:hypothetical protein